jgi:hypothetical protein
MDRPESSFWDKSPKQGLTIMEFVEGGYSKSACNGQTRVLTGQLGADSMREDSLELAIENVSKDFQAVGIMERFDESLVYFRAKLDWKSHCCYVQKNVSKRRDMTVTQSDIDTIRRHNRLDIELYDYVQREFQDQLNLACENSERSLFLHRQCNRFYPFVNKIGSGVLDVMRAVKRQVREVGGV